MIFIKFVDHKGKVKQVKKKVTSFSELQEASAKVWSSETRPYNYCYLDVDGEEISIIDDQDWETCLEEVNAIQEDRKVKKVTILMLMRDPEIIIDPKTDESVPVLAEEEEEVQLKKSDKNDKIKDEIQSMIECKVGEQLKNTLMGMNLLSQGKKSDSMRLCESSSESVHRGITCDNCGVHPIVGIRFKSMMKEDYDLCESCESSVGLDHSFIRFRKPCNNIYSLNSNWEKYSRPFRNGFQECSRKFGTNSQKQESQVERDHVRANRYTRLAHIRR